MMWEWKRCIKLLKYSYGFKANLIGSIVMLVLGIWFSLDTFHMGVRRYMMTSVFIFLSFIIMLQLKDNMSFSNMIMASHRKKFLEITFTDIYSVIGGIGSYLLHAFLVIFFANKKFLEETSTASVLMITGITIAIFVIYFGFCNKFFGLALIVSYITYFIVEVWSDIFFVNGMGDLVKHNILLGLVVGALFVAAGIVVSMVLRRLLYRKATSIYIGSFGLRRAMQ